MCHKRHKPYTKSTKDWTTYSPMITTIAMSFSRNIPNTLLLGHCLHLLYLQPKEQHLQGRGVSYVRISEGVSSPH
jgi:hypothetical protein